MLRLIQRAENLRFRHPFTISKATKTHQPTLLVGLGLGSMWGFGEAPAISYYGVTVEAMQETLERHRADIERYALQDPERFWHFLHHLIPGENFLTCALDIAGWDLFGQMRRRPLRDMLGIPPETPVPPTDFTIGLDTAEAMVTKLRERPWPVYKVKLGRPDDLDLIRAIRAATKAPLRVDANEGWTYEDALRLLPELQKLGVVLVEQPLPRGEQEAQAALKAKSPLHLFADESCVTESDVADCRDGFHGINIKLVKCGGITPARRMVQGARALGLRVMLGSMNESTLGTAALAHLAPLADVLDADGPLLLAEDLAEGIRPEGARWQLSGAPGLGIRMWRTKADARF